MKTKTGLVIMLALALTLPGATLMLAQQAGMGSGAAPTRPEGPCDVYAAADNPCVAAHSTTRALYSSYNGPLYQVMRQSDGQTLDIGVVPPSEMDGGGYADAAAQDEFCANTYCWITTIYDQSEMDNHLVQAPRGGFSGPAMGGFNNLPMADMAPVTLMGHKVYGVFIEPGMGLRWNDPKGTAVDDQAEGQYWVINGHHYNSGCCFDYGNGETDSRDDGDGTMETTYYGNASGWYRGSGHGPWVMTDQENNLVGCVNPSPNDKYCEDLPSIGWRFVTATADGEPGHWRSMGGDAQRGDLAIMFDGPRVINDRSSYDPMRKQGAILLGNGGDNSNGSQGTFYEGAMTAPGTFPTEETNQEVQANVIAAGYDVQRLSIAPASATLTPPGLQTFSPGSTQDTTVVFTNTTGAHVRDLTLGIRTPEGWTVAARTPARITGSVAPGQSVSTTFSVRSGPAAFNGDLVGTASWLNTVTEQRQSEIAIEKVRNVRAIKINEFAVGSGSPENSTNAFIELYNAGAEAVDLSGWTLTQHPTQMPVFSPVEIPGGTRLAAGDFYLMGLSNSGLEVAAQPGDSTIYVREAEGMSVGDTIRIGAGSAMETRRIASLEVASDDDAPGGRGGFGRGGFGRGGGAGGATTVWQPIPDGPVITIPAGSTNIPVASVNGFEVGQKMAIGHGATYPTVAQAIERNEVVTVTEVGKPGTQAWLSMDARAGDTNIKVSSVENISVGDQIRLDIDSVGHGIETVTVTGVGTASERSTFRGPLLEGEAPGTGLDLAEPLKFDHSSNMPFSARGTGISFEPAAAFDHSSNEPVLPLRNVITLDSPLDSGHAIHAVVRSAGVATAGFQGQQEPDQWFGGPALANAGNMVLRDAAGLVVDSLNYGGLVDPWAAEGYQAASGAGEDGCSVPAPASGGRGFGFGFGRGGGPAGDAPNLSAGRVTDGLDTDSNCDDFQVQTANSLSIATAAGSNNIKVDSVEGFVVGQTIVIDAGDNQETVVIARVGTAGGTTVGSAIEAGATEIPIESAAGFNAGQTITVGGGANAETAVVASVSGGRGLRGGFGGGFGGGRGGFAGATITVAAPLALAHAEGAEIAGDGITLRTALSRAHEGGVQVAGGVPTPGAPNQF